VIPPASPGPRPAGLPRAAILGLALVVSGETVLQAAVPYDRGKLLAGEVLSEIERGTTTRPLFLWSDSVSTVPVRRSGGDDRVEEAGSAAAVTMAGVYFIYRRRVLATGAPRVLVLAAIPEFYTRFVVRPGPGTAGAFERTFTDFREALEFADATGDWGFASRMALNGLFLPPSARRRSVLDPVLRRMGSPAGPFPVRPRTGAGAAPGPPDRAAPLRGRASQRGFRASPIALEFLRRLCRETGRTGTRLVLMTPALPREVSRSWEESGYLDEYRGMLEGMARDHPHVAVDPVLQFADYGSEDMSDPRHVVPDLEPAYGRRVVARLLALLEETEAAGPR